MVMVWSLHSFLSLKDLLMGLTPPGARAILNLATWHFLHLHILKMAKRTFLWETMLYFTQSVVAPQWYFLRSVLTQCVCASVSVCLAFPNSLNVKFLFHNRHIYVKRVTTKTPISHQTLQATAKTIKHPSLNWALEISEPFLRGKASVSQSGWKATVLARVFQEQILVQCLGQQGNLQMSLTAIRVEEVMETTRATVNPPLWTYYSVMKTIL